MKTKIQIKSILGNVLFELEKEDNTIKDTVIEARRQKANLSGADLLGAKIDDIEKLKEYFWIIPEEGSFIGWKKLENNCIAKLQIPAKAKRTCNLMSRKCRAEYVKVLGIWNKDGEKIQSAQNHTSDKKLLYVSGKTVKPDSYDDSPFVDCSHGIHFFLIRHEAEGWQ
jgi:hypothetical protein